MLTGLLLIPTIASIVTIMLLEAKKEQLSLEMGVEKHELLLCQNIKLAIKSMLQGLLLGVALILLEASLTIFIY